MGLWQHHVGVIKRIRDVINKRVIVTGGDGFLAHHLIPLLMKEYYEVFPIKHEAYDLLVEDRVKAMYDNIKPDIVIHLAARVGGIQYNQLNPAKLFYENLQMGVHLIHLGHLFGKLEKFVCLGSVCSYPVSPPIPFREDDLWNGFPESTNAGYGIAKRSLEEMCRVYREQYEMNNIFLLPCNLYGIADDFSQESAHVVPMLIKRTIEAKERKSKELIVWGSGNATREFLYAGDCAKLILSATQNYNDKWPINLGSGKETSIKELAELIAELVDYKGEIVWDESRPDGQPRRFLDISRSIMWLGFNPENAMPLREGLKRTIDWYYKNKGDL